MEPALRGIETEAEDLGGFFAPQAFELAEHEDLAILGREGFERALEQGPLLETRGLRFRRPGFVGEAGFLAEGVDRVVTGRLAGAEPAVADGGMPPDGEEPRAGGLLDAGLRGPAEGREEGLLEHVLGVRLVAHERPQVAEDGCLVTPHEAMERGLLAARDAREQLGVAQLPWG